MGASHALGTSIAHTSVPDVALRPTAFRSRKFSLSDQCSGDNATGANPPGLKRQPMELASP